MILRALIITFLCISNSFSAASEASERTVADLVRSGRILLHSAVTTVVQSGEKYLNLQECGLTSLFGLKTLPGITTVQYLDIRDNRLSSLTREDMACMIHLKHIYANRNQIEYIAEDAFAENPDLIGVSFPGNKLAEATAIINIFAQLHFIDLASNKLQSFKPRVGNPNLMFFNVTDNPVPGAEPDTGTLLLRCFQLKRPIDDRFVFCTQEYYTMKSST